MKKMIMALVLLGAINYTSSAQSNGKYAKNYKVCRADDGAYVVCSDEQGEYKSSGTRISAYSATRLAEPPTITPMAVVPCVNITQPAGRRVGYRWDKERQVKVYYEDVQGNQVEEPLAPKYGKDSPQYGSADQNAARNLNYGSGQYVPPMDGTIR